MRTKTNVASLGDALLLLHYFPYKDKRWERKTTVHNKIEPNLQEICFDGQKHNSLFLWGTTTGIKEIQITKEKSGSMLYFVSRKIKTKEELYKYSHFILTKVWSSKSPFVISDTETVEIYRLTQANKKLIETNWGWVPLEDN